MTVLEASGSIYEWYQQHDSFVLEDNLKDVAPNSSSIEKDNAALWCALLDFEKMEMVNSCEIDGRRYWILRKGFDSFEQTVVITPMVAVTIAGMVNTYCDSLEVDSEKADPANIEEKDIKNLLFILNQSLGMSEKN